MTEVEQQPPPQNGIDLSANEDDDHNKSRPADIEQDMREMERRKRVEAIMGSKLFREELERIVDSARDGGTSGILQQLSDIVGLPAARVGSVYKASNCLMPINDIRGVESMGYAKGEKILRCKLAATFRLLDLYGWTQGLGAQITARLKVDQEYFLVNPYGLLYHEITASSLNKVDMQGNIVEQGTTNFGVNKSHFILHSVVHAARPDIRCAIYIGCSPVVAVSSLKTGLLPLTKDACVLGEVTTHSLTGLLDNDERDRLIHNLGPNSKVMLLSNHGALCCGETIEEAFFAACHIVQACETQLKLLPVGLDNLSLIPEETRKIIYEQSRRPPEELEKKFAAITTNEQQQQQNNDESDAAPAPSPKIGQAPKWRVGGAEFEALMRMLDNAGYRTGYIYRHPLIKSDPPKPKNDVELPPAVSSLGYLLEEEELFRQGIWKKGDIRKGGDRSRWLNSPNVYQKVEVLETGTPDPKKITKWVAEGSPTHSTPVRIEDPLQFVPAGTNPKEFKRLQQQIKDNRRADKISAGPQSHILEGVTWDEASRIRDATVSATGDHVVLMGAASKGIIQRGFQHNATVYKAPYAKNPFDNVTDDELNEYKRTVERKKKSIHGEYTDTDFSESEAISSLPVGLQGKHGKKVGGTQSEPEDMGAHQVMRIETQQAPVPSQPEVVLSDATLSFLNGERTHTAVNRKPPTGRALKELEIRIPSDEDFIQLSASFPSEAQQQQQFYSHNNSNMNGYKMQCMQTNSLQELFTEMQNTTKFLKQKEKLSNSNNNDCNADGFGVSSINTQEAVNALLTLSNATNNLMCNKTTSQMAEFIYKRKPALTPNEFCKQATTATTATITTSSSNFSSSLASSFDSTNNCSGLTAQTSMNRLKAYKAVNNSKLNVCAVAGEKSSQQHLIYSGHGLRRRTAIARRSHICPYRTVSHFGFNSPRNTKQPEHKHIPLDNQNLYVPLKNTASYEEIFSSPRYIDFCDNCFEQIARLKPEYLKFAQSQNLQKQSECECEYVYDYVNADEIHSRPLAPLSEVEEYNSCTTTTEIIDDHEHEYEIIRETSSEDSTFLEKIMRMNYSEESTNNQFTPHAVTSNLSISHINDTNTCSQRPVEHTYIENELAQNMAALTVAEPMKMLPICVTEILEFGNWQNSKEEEINSVEEDENESCQSMSVDVEKCKQNQVESMGRDFVLSPLESPQNKLDDNDFFQIDENDQHAKNCVDLTQKSEPVFDSNETYASCASNIISNPDQFTFHHGSSSQSIELETASKSMLMSRNERLQRKMDFQELWEDHIAYFESKKSHDKQHNSSDDHNSTEDANDKEVEVFFGRSVIKRGCLPLATSSAASTPLHNVSFDSNDSFTSIFKTNLDEMKLNDVERRVVTTINENNLKQCDDGNLFEKIENAILNKRSPTVLECFIKEQCVTSTPLKDANNTNATTTTTMERNVKKQTSNGNEAHKCQQRQLNLKKRHQQHQQHGVQSSTTATIDNNRRRQHEQREHVSRSRSIRRKNGNDCSPPAKKVSRKTTTPPAPPRKNNNIETACNENTPQNQKLCAISNTKSVDSSKRNFVRENIKNAAKIRSPRTPRTPRRMATTPAETAAAASKSATQVEATQIESFSCSSSTTIYPFQSKVVRGSPCFWISAAASPTKIGKNKLKLQQQQLQQEKEQEQQSQHNIFTFGDENENVNNFFIDVAAAPIANPLDSDGNNDDDDLIFNAANISTNVDLEIEALTAKMNSLEPSVDNIKRKCENFGETVAKCSRTLDECIALQADIVVEQQKLRNDIALNQYAEQVMCRVQTYSISEGDD